MSRPERVAIELELDGPPEQVLRLPVLTGLRAGRSLPQRIVWHDTADGALAAAGHVLAESTGDGAAVWRLQPARRDGIVPWPPGTAAPLLAEEATSERFGRGLRPLAAFDGNRRRLTPTEGGLSELALLEGELHTVTSRRTSRRLCLTGDPAAVFTLARRLLEEPVAAAQVPAQDLAGAALSLLRPAGAPAAPVLHAGLSPADALAHVVGQLAASLLHHAPAAALGQSPEPVHQMRVTLRRLRSALALFRPLADGPSLQRLRRELRELARTLGPARDWDVFVGGTGRQLSRALPGDAAIRRLLAAAERRRRVAYADLAGTLAKPAFQQTLLGLVELAVARPWVIAPAEPTEEGTSVAVDPTLVAYATTMLRRRWRQAVRDAGDLDLPPEALHALRIRCKRLRYAAEFFAPLFPHRSEARKFLRRLSAVQERLGRLNDATVAGTLMGELGRSGYAAGVVRGWVSARGTGDRARAARSWQRFRRTEPFWA